MKINLETIWPHHRDTLWTYYKPNRHLSYIDDSDLLLEIPPRQVLDDIDTAEKQILEG